MINVKRIIFGLSLLLLVVIIFGTWVAYENREIFLDPEPERKPKMEIPITYTIGGWPYQSKMRIDSFNVSIIESRPSLFNWKTLIEYKVKGQLKFEGKWRPYVKEVHVTERLLTNDSTGFIDFYDENSLFSYFDSTGHLIDLMLRIKSCMVKFRLPQ